MDDHIIRGFVITTVCKSCSRSIATQVRANGLVLSFLSTHMHFFGGPFGLSGKNTTPFGSMAGTAGEPAGQAGQAHPFGTGRILHAEENVTKKVRILDARSSDSEDEWTTNSSF